METPTVTITNEPLADVEILAPGERGIYQNVQTILSTWRGTVFLDRRFGIDPAFVDKPMNKVRNQALSHITATIEKYEPRVQVVSVNLEHGAAGSGSLIINVQVKIRNGVLL